MGSITITGWHASPEGPSFSRGTPRSFSSTLLRRWPGSDRVQNLHRDEHEFARPQFPWLSARQYAIFFFADHRGTESQRVADRRNRLQSSVKIFLTSFSKTRFITSNVTGNPFAATSAFAFFQRVSSLAASKKSCPAYVRHRGA